jgi:hypothetical protein
VGASCLDFAGSDGIWLCELMFFLTVWFQRERCEALLALTIMGHAFSPMVKSSGGERCASRDVGTSNDDLTFCGDE